MATTVDAERPKRKHSGKWQGPKRCGHCTERWAPPSDPSTGNKLLSTLCTRTPPTAARLPTRYHSTKSDDQQTGLKDHIPRMPEERQKGIYYLTGESLDSIRGPTFLQRFGKTECSSAQDQPHLRVSRHSAQEFQ
ncbi:hypothetical protein A4X13_0g4695 [Tilletia indica]|uniref:Uncharacterized protein n=1 Tax=Tilletia indica TaxID=43049 RepID=A0A177TRA6_9BASI|nr:hypothetical protein A4X13_0g4695 [Tilletia indica]